MKDELISITMDDLQFIMGSSYIHFDKIIKNTFCSSCGEKTGNHITEITDYKIFLNNLNDIVLKGKCKKCNNPVGRYITTGENPESKKRAEEVWKKSEFKINKG